MIVEHVACYSVAMNPSARDKDVSQWRVSISQAYLDILTLTFMRMFFCFFVFPSAENEYQKKKKKCLKIYLIKELRCMCFSFCVGVCGPNISDILITCRIENAASERNALWSCEECPIQVLSGTICVSLKMWAP